MKKILAKQAQFSNSLKIIKKDQFITATENVRRHTGRHTRYSVLPKNKQVFVNTNWVMYRDLGISRQKIYLRIPPHLQPDQQSDHLTIFQEDRAAA
jgi:hypothetical protein